MVLKKAHRSKRSAHGSPAGGDGGGGARRLFPVAAVFFCFFVSGMAGLTYQTLWVRLIDKVIGSAPFAVAAVVSAFMGGLALGSYAAGKYIDRFCERRGLLALYGYIEIAIALYALASPLLIRAMKPLYTLAYAWLWPYPFLYTLLTFCGCLLLLIVPTTLMGATLPVLCRYTVTRLGNLGTNAGGLYSLNTLGAAAGALLCGFVLIPGLGVRATLAAAAAVNLAVGAGCWLLAGLIREPGVNTKGVRSGVRASKAAAPAIRTGKPEALAGKAKAAVAAQPPQPFQPTQPPRGPEVIRALAVFGVSGFCAMACEVFWTRLIGLIIGPTTYAFTVVVATFIVGLAAGGMLFGWLGDKLERDAALLFGTQLCAAMLSLAVSQLLGDSQFFFAKVIQANQDRFSLLLVWQTLLLFILMLGPTLCWGAAFPLVNRICTHRLEAIGRSIGGAYAVNTIGAIIGAFAAGFVFIPMVGKEAGLRLTIGFQWGAASLGLICLAWQAKTSWGGRLIVLLLVVAGLGALLRYPAWQPGLLSRGWYRDFGALRDELARTGWIDALLNGKTVLAAQRCGQQLLFQGEGIGGFTTVEKETTSLGHVEVAMFNSGKADASSHGDRSTQTLSGHIPLMFHPLPKKVMVLGLASGMTCGEALLYPLDRLDILEINEQVAKACRLFFAPFNRNCLDDPRTRLILQDGRNHLALTRQRYDVIISEPSNPWMAGLANLYSLEFFQLVKQRLTEHGIFAQWIQSYEMDWDTFSLLGRTFSSVFSSGALFKVGPGDYLLVGTADSNGLDWENARRNLIFAQRSDKMVITDAASLAHLVVTEALPCFFGSGDRHTDNHPRLEYAAPRRLFGGGVDMDRIAAGNRRLRSETRALLSAASSPDDLLNLVELAASLYLPLFSSLDRSVLDARQQERYMGILRAYCGCVLVPAYQVLGDTESRRACAEIQANLIGRHLDRAAGRAVDDFNYGLALAAAGRNTEAIQAFKTAIDRDASQPQAHTALGLLEAQAGRFPEAIRYLRTVVTLTPDQAEAYRNLGMAQAQAGELAAAAGNLAKAVNLDRNDVTALNESAMVQLRMNRVSEARESLLRALRIDDRNPETHYNLGRFYFSQGRFEQAVSYFQEALRLSPDNANARKSLLTALAALERSPSR